MIEITPGGLFLIIACVAFVIFWTIYKKVKPKNQSVIIENTAPFAIMNSQEITKIKENEKEIEEEIITEEEDESELIAVISAAVAAALKKPVSGFRVVAFKKRGGWQ